MKTVSCGIVICHPGAALLMCHATGTAHWDVPKGSGEADETSLQTALREAAEECGLVFAPAELMELGRFHYRPGKDLHLYAALTDALDVARCRCSTHFRGRFGRDLPEMDAFAWVPFDEVPARCAKSLAALLSGPLPLPPLLDRLLQRGHLAQPRWLDAAAEG